MLWDVFASLAPLAFVGCDLVDYGSPWAQLVVLDVGGRLPQGLRSSAVGRVMVGSTSWTARRELATLIIEGYENQVHLRGLRLAKIEVYHPLFEYKRTVQLLPDVTLGT